MRLTKSGKIADSPPTKHAAKSFPVSLDPIAPAGSSRLPDVGDRHDSSPKKRKHDDLDEANPKLQEFLEAFGHPAKKSRDLGTPNGALGSETLSTVEPVVEAGESDDEYE